MDEVDEVPDLYLSEDELGAASPTAPPDIGSLYVKLHWPEVDLPKRWAPMLQKALQSWFNTALVDEMHISCNIHRLEPLETPGCAMAKITPFSALDVLLSKKSSSLTFKDLKQTAVVHFYSSVQMINAAKISTQNNPTYSSGEGSLFQIPIKVNAVVDVQKCSSQIQAEIMEKFEKHSSGTHCLSMQGTLEEVNMFYAELCQTVMQKEQGENDESLSAAPIETQASEEEGSQEVSCRVPLSLYRAACQTYRKEMDFIERENSVRIQAEIILNFRNRGTGRDMRLQACKDMTRLLQNCVEPPRSQLDLPVGTTMTNSEFLVPKKDASSHSRGLDCPDKTEHISEVVCRVKGQTEGDVKNHESGQPVGVDMSTGVLETGKMKECTRSGMQQGKKADLTAVGKPGVVDKRATYPTGSLGDQPNGNMFIRKENESLPGFLGHDTLVIDYDIPSAAQTNDHPNPGKPFDGLQVSAYLPNSPEGRQVLELLKKAFSQRLVFTVGVSNNTGKDGCVNWNGISHKTSKYGGHLSNGYPDPDYIKQVKRELKAKGIE
ncbi:hypothetical protein AALO_G00140570 [Alosa alosa]|uniref:E3 ubiquitin-protein ligase n=1 Tax=Alosa alosa TaxID=278164 RepID=A0AAV6GPP6_9TELE|nr:uncharacterized protein LOC125301674 [Alosa alosa]KAG5274826.1 hypothetical protein AALO_G00140570 [Alosa alosa]